MYEELLEALMNEVENKSLQRLPPTLYAKLGDALRELQSRISDGAEGKVARKVLLSQLDMMTRVLTELVELRLGKMSLAALSRSELPEGSIAGEEKGLLSASTALTRVRDELVDNLVGKPLPSSETTPQVERPMLMVRIIKDVPLIVGADLRNYGPFKPEDVALLPAQNAEALVKQGAALHIRVE